MCQGKYTLTVSANDTLIFSMLGMATQIVPVKGRTVINVTMKEELQSMAGVVVIGYGTVKKSDLTGSVGSVKSVDLTKITSLNPEQGLQGKSYRCSGDQYLRCTRSTCPHSGSGVWGPLTTVPPFLW